MLLYIGAYMKFIILLSKHILKLQKDDRNYQNVF